MKIGYVGAGKLGMPVAACVAQKHDVKLYDAVPEIHSRWGRYPFEESARGTPYGSINELMHAVTGNVSRAESMADMCDCDIIFVAVQTPHAREYEGDLPLGPEPKDFDYSFLRDALFSLADALKDCERKITVAVISTCLPGTYEREFKEASKGWNFRLVYNPYFIAMGTVIPDFLDPEFVLIGDRPDYFWGPNELLEFYGSLGLRDRVRMMDITSAEATKVFYNTFISTKLSLANAIAEGCESIGADIDAVMGAIKAADKRLISTAYLTPGMGDGGACHGRDNIALSWFAKQQGLSFDFFGMIMKQREAQAERYAKMVYDEFYEANGALNIGIVGYAFKANTNIVTGSHAVLVANFLRRMMAPTQQEPCLYDRFCNGADPTEPGVFLIGCRHAYIPGLAFPKGSVVIDPWGIVPDQEGVEIRRLGRTRSPGKLETMAVA